MSTDRDRKNYHRQRYYIKNRDKIIQASRQWNIKNKERKRELDREHYYKHIDAYKEKGYKRRESQLNRLNDKYSKMCSPSAQNRHPHKYVNISREEYIECALKPCLYCGEVDGESVDRIDSNIGYEANNIVPSCWPCNALKRAYHIQTFYLQMELKNLKNILTKGSTDPRLDTILARKYLVIQQVRNLSPDHLIQDKEEDNENKQ
jgi:hypothetical protein